MGTSGIPLIDLRPYLEPQPAYPLKSSARIVAGDSIDGEMFKCALKPVSAALADGTYGLTSFTDDQKAQIEAIFPTGVCDYTQRDLGRPAGY